MKFNAPINDASVRMNMIHYSYVAYRIGKRFDIDDKTEYIFDRDVIKIWSRDYEDGWKAKV